MKTSESIDQIATALAAAQGEMKNATLNRQNPHFKSKYADLAGIRDTVTPALSKHGIAVVHGIDVMESGLAVVTRLIHTSGQWVESRFPIAYDKPQTMGSGITYGRRYNLSAITNIAADEDDDANAANDGGKVPEAPKKAQAYDRNPIVRAEFAKIQKGIHDIERIGSLDDLALFWKNNAESIKAMPADWKVELEQMKDDAKAALSQKEAA